MLQTNNSAPTVANFHMSLFIAALILLSGSAIAISAMVARGATARATLGEARPAPIATLSLPVVDSTLAPPSGTRFFATPAIAMDRSKHATLSVVVGTHGPFVIGYVDPSVANGEFSQTVPGVSHIHVEWSLRETEKAELLDLWQMSPHSSVVTNSDSVMDIRVEFVLDDELLEDVASSETLDISLSMNLTGGRPMPQIAADVLGTDLARTSAEGSPEHDGGVQAGIRLGTVFATGQVGVQVHSVSDVSGQGIILIEPALRSLEGDWMAENAASIERRRAWIQAVEPAAASGAGGTRAYSIARGSATAPLVIARRGLSTGSMFVLSPSVGAIESAWQEGPGLLGDTRAQLQAFSLAPDDAAFNTDRSRLPFLLTRQDTPATIQCFDISVVPSDPNNWWVVDIELPAGHCLYVEASSGSPLEDRLRVWCDPAAALPNASNTSPRVVASNSADVPSITTPPLATVLRGDRSVFRNFSPASDARFVRLAVRGGAALNHALFATWPTEVKGPNHLNAKWACGSFPLTFATAPDLMLEVTGRFELPRRGEPGAHVGVSARKMTAP